MAGYVISPRAQTDLDEIWDFSADRFGPDRADRYVLDIKHALERIADDPRRGRPCDDIRPGYRKYRAGAHMIFFRHVPDGVEVVRVLHQSMDFPRHF